MDGYRDGGGLDSMTKLGSVSIYIPKGAKVYGIVLMDEKQKPIGGTGITPIRPASGDIIDVEFLEDPTKVSA